jgi:phage terminase large subunit
MLNSDIAKVLPKGVPVYADSAEPKSIEEIRRFGISIKGVTKGKDSINYGIQVMQGYWVAVLTLVIRLIRLPSLRCTSTTTNE